MNDRPVSAVFIDPWSKSVEEIQVPLNEDFSALLRCHYISHVNLGHGLQMIIDDMGALPPKQGGPKTQRFFRLKEIMKGEPPIGGFAIILGFDAVGNTKSTPPHLADFITSHIEWPAIHAADVVRSESVEKHPQYGDIKVFRTEIMFGEGNRDEDTVR